MADKPAPAPDYLIGLDLGQRQDFTAVAVLQRQLHVGQTRTEATYTARALHRFELGTPYPAMLDKIAEWVKADPLRGCALVVDQTGVGQAVVDMLRQAALPCRIIAVTITGGNAVTAPVPGEYHVPKKELVGILHVLLGNRRLILAKGLPLAAALQGELQAFTVKISKAGNDTFESWRERDHDDLVLAVSLAAWVGEKVCRPWDGAMSLPKRSSLADFAPRGVFNDPDTGAPW